MIGFDEALALVRAHAQPLGPEQVPLKQAHRRILAEPVTALVDSPWANVSAMDGYAARRSEAVVGSRLRVTGESFPGVPFGGSVGAGQCVRIFTGGPVPDGLDCVVIQENVSREGDIATVNDQSPTTHIRVQGSDFRAGDTLLERGRMLDSRALIAAGGADVASVTVWRRPRISALGTGDELAEPGTARFTPGSIPESLSIGVAAMVEEWGGEAIAGYRLRDEPALITAAAQEAIERSDLVIVTGGASVGDKDFAKSAFAAAGLELIFSKVAIKPGKPVWFGRAGHTLVMGLPGNPTSAMVTGRLLLAPLIVGLSGGDPGIAARWTLAPLATPLGKTGDRETFHRGRWQDGSVEVLRDQDSGAQKALSEADLLIRRASDAAAASEGQMVEILTF